MRQSQKGSVLPYLSRSLTTSSSLRLVVFSSCAEPWSAASIGLLVVIPHQFGRVLVVDDNEDLALLFSMLVEQMGYETCTAFSAKAALEILLEFSPHVVFSDIGMPGASGYDLAQMVRDGNLPQPYLISVSGWNDAKTVKASFDAGFNLNLGKPVSSDQVSLLLRNHFRLIGIGN